MGKFSKVLIASDFDNTLVYTQGALDAGLPIPELSARDRAALDRFLGEGGYFTVATGRAVPAFAEYAAKLPMNAPAIVANGAGLYDYRRDAYLCTAFLSPQVRAHIGELLAALPGTAFEVYHPDRRIHCMHPNRFIESHEHLTRTEAERVASFDEIDLPLIKVLFEDETDRLETIRAFVLSRPWHAEYELIYSGDHLLEMTARGATKGGMVLRLAEMLGVKREDIYCMGDHANDLSMLEIAAVGFAPANAIAAVKSSGATIVCHCADGALADVIAILERRYADR